MQTPQQFTVDPYGVGAVLIIIAALLFTKTMEKKINHSKRLQTVAGTLLTMAGSLGCIAVFRVSGPLMGCIMTFLIGTVLYMGLVLTATTNGPQPSTVSTRRRGKVIGLALLGIFIASNVHAQGGSWTSAPPPAAATISNINYNMAAVKETILKNPDRRHELKAEFGTQYDIWRVSWHYPCHTTPMFEVELHQKQDNTEVWYIILIFADGLNSDGINITVGGSGAIESVFVGANGLSLKNPTVTTTTAEIATDCFNQFLGWRKQLLDQLDNIAKGK